MPRGLLAMLILAVLLLPAVGCLKPQSVDSRIKQAASNVAGATELSLPSSWPLTEIVPPQGAAPAPRNYSVSPGYGNDYMATGSPFNQGSENAGKLWSVGFSYRRGWEQARQHFDHCIPATWRLYCDRPAIREYISPDSRYITQLYYNGEENTFMLSIFVYDEILSGTHIEGV